MWGWGLGGWVGDAVLVTESVGLLDALVKVWASFRAPPLCLAPIISKGWGSKRLCGGGGWVR